MRIKMLVWMTCLVCFASCSGQSKEKHIVLGAERFEEYLPDLDNKRIALLVNHSSFMHSTHLLDTLLSKNINVCRIFAPEHGFRGTADAGEHIKNKIDSRTGLPITSMYGKSKKPSAESLQEIDVVIFDIQDVGVRFFTYISSMHYMMEACAENGIEFIVLDRPNPNGDYFDGPILKDEFKSFVGMHPIPVVHGLTVGELALMINGEGWLKGGLKCQLKVIKMDHYSRDMRYDLPIKPSPNLPNYKAIRLYPSLCFFEATQLSIGRGTHMPFQIIGYPDSCMGNYSFTPRSIVGMAKNPLHQDKRCYGIDLRNEQSADHFTLSYFLDFMNKCVPRQKLLDNERWFNLLAGNDALLNKIKQGWSEQQIKDSWKPELKQYGLMRSKYLLYH